MLRACNDGSELGELVASYIDGGNLAPDDLVMRFMTERLGRPDCEKGCLFDGFPRTVNQARMLDAYLAERQQRVDLVVSLVADKDALIQRLLDRAETQQRADDTIETIRSRLKIFAERTAPVLEHYVEQGIVRSIDAMAPPDVVFASIFSVVTTGL
jgi:adenylate kinase